MYYRIKNGSIIDFGKSKYSSECLETDQDIVTGYDGALYFAGKAPVKPICYDKFKETLLAYGAFDSAGAWLPDKLGYNVLCVKHDSLGKYTVTFINPLPNKYYRVEFTRLPKEFNTHIVPFKDRFVVEFVKHLVVPIDPENLTFTVTISTTGQEVKE